MGLRTGAGKCVVPASAGRRECPISARGKFQRLTRSEDAQPGGAAGAVRIELRNVGEHAVSGRVRLQLTPVDRGTLQGGAEIRFKGLKPGATLTAERKVVLEPAAGKVLVEAVPDVPFANTASLTVSRGGK